MFSHRHIGTRTRIGLGLKNAPLRQCQTRHLNAATERRQLRFNKPAYPQFNQPPNHTIHGRIAAMATAVVLTSTCSATMLESEMIPSVDCTDSESTTTCWPCTTPSPRANPTTTHAQHNRNHPACHCRCARHGTTTEGNVRSPPSRRQRRTLTTPLVDCTMISEPPPTLELVMLMN